MFVNTQARHRIQQRKRTKRNEKIVSYTLLILAGITGSFMAYAFSIQLTLTTTLTARTK